jgi:hypothetical protein
MEVLNQALCWAALREVERQYGLKYVPEKLPKGSMLLEASSSVAFCHLRITDVQERHSMMTPVRAYLFCC